jgi:DNA recombination-dependent growth factor C
VAEVSGEQRFWFWGSWLVIDWFPRALFAWNRVASLIISEDVAWVSTDRAASWLVPFAESFLTIINWWLGSLNWSPLAFSLEVVASIFVIDVHASISRANSGLVN